MSQLYRPDIQYVQGMSSLIYQILEVCDNDIYETFALTVNLLVGNQLMRNLYMFNEEAVGMC